jgi:hypothetical protein
MSDLMNRREFLEASAAGAGAVLLGTQLVGKSAAGEGEDWPPKLPPVKIHKVFVRGSGGWPKPDLDVKAEIAMLEKHLEETERKLGDVKFVGGELVQSSEEAAKVAAKFVEADGVLVFHLAGIVEPVIAPILDAGCPTVVFSQPYSGHDWSKICKLPKAGKKVVLLATSNYGEIAELAGVMRVAPRLRQTRIIHIGRQWGTTLSPKLKEKLGVEVVQVEYDRFRKIYDAIDNKLVEAETDEWVKEAEKVVEPSRDDVRNASRVYFTMKQLITQEKAQAITINCLGGFPLDQYGYQCLGFSKLNDQGIVAACEADMDSALTMLIFGYAFGVPGFISDPVFDTSTNTVVHAHCVSATKMDGSDGPRCPYIIRNHLERYKGAGLQVKFRVGQPITCAKLINLETMLISTGKIIGNPDVDRGCRSKMATSVANARKMLDNWGCGMVEGGMVEHLHRVLFYGDHLQNIKHLGVLMGLKVIEEG